MTNGDRETFSLRVLNMTDEPIKDNRKMLAAGCQNVEVWDAKIDEQYETKQIKQNKSWVKNQKQILTNKKRWNWWHI